MNESNQQNNLLIKNTLFINLVNRPDRCSHIQQELSKIGILAPVRFNAVKTNMGQVGCSMSHLKCLEMAKKEGWKHVFICEDDAVFTDPAILLKRLDKAQQIPVWDVLIVGGNNQRPFFPSSYDGFIQVHNCQTTTAYIVKQAYYDSLIQNIKESLKRLLREPQLKHLFSIDIYWKSLQIKDTWLMAIPATVSQLDGISDIEDRHVSYNHMMLDHEKKFLNESAPVHMKQMFYFNPSGHNKEPTRPLPNEATTQSVLSGTGWGKGFLKTMPIVKIQSQHIPTLSGIKSNK